MLGKSRFTLTTATVLMVFVLSAIWTVPAFADDTTPPPVDTPTEVAPPPAEEPAPVEEPAVVEAPPAEPIVEEVLPTEPVAAEEAPAEEPASLPEVLEQLPEGTDVMVVNADGDVLPLASEEAAQVIVNGDPMWCPVGVVPGAATCSPSFTTFNQDNVTPLETGLIDWLITNQKNVAGVIWIASDYDGSLETGNVIQLNGADFNTMHNFALTLQGGWSGGNNMTVNTLAPSQITLQLVITGWNGNITLKDLLITATAADATTRDALVVNTTKNIILERVTVQDSFNSGGGTYNGAYLDNTAGGTGTGNVTINNSNFQGNEGDGLTVFSRGVITTTNLTANLNGGLGAFFANDGAATDKAVTLKGLKQFNNNGADGLVIFSRGAVTLSTVVANNNGGTGVFVDNRTSLTKLGVTVGGTNYFINNFADGLVVYSHGTITAANLNASDNGGNGAWLDNCDLNGVPQCQMSVAKPVTLTGVNTFNNNGVDGLHLLSWGSISVSNIIASNNVDDGAYIDNQWLNNAVVPKVSVGLWTLNGYGIFNNNINGDGLSGYSHANMILNNLTANANGDDGVDLNADKPVGSATVTLRGINTFSDNAVDGLYISADGRITLSSISAYFNSGDGAELYTDDFGMGFTLTGANTFMYNGDYGLYMQGPGAITVSNLTASFNNIGSYMDNFFDPTKPYNVTLTGSNSFNDNNGQGLGVYSYGAIMVNNLTANGNGHVNSDGYGAFLNNCIWDGVSACYAITPKPVTLTGSVNVNENYQSGIYVDSIGAVTMTNVSADGNLEYGVEIYNSYNNTKPQNVTLKGSNSFNNNGADGLRIFSYGAIALNNITANWNGGDGVELDNFRGGSYITVKTIILTGVNSFLGNYYDGLYFDASGAVTLNRVSADWNGDFGGDPGYQGSGIRGYSDRGITLVCGHTFLNEGTGYDLSAFGGSLIIKGIYSAYNGLGDLAFGFPSVVVTKACALP